MPPPDMSGIAEKTILGIDLAGVTGSTGFVVLEGAVRPSVTEAALLPNEPTPALAEESLVALIDRIAPDRLTIDAPLTLPPCLTCPQYCRGPGELCELSAAREMWADGSNPVIRRQCEVETKRLIPGSTPNPTMDLGIITARAVTLVRKLQSRRTEPLSVAGREILEIYPAASLRQMGWTKRPSKTASLEARGHFYTQVVDSLASEIDGLDDSSKCRTDDDIFDALIAAYTGWLYPEGLVHPPAEFNLASGWIWFPKAKDASISPVG